MDKLVLAFCALVLAAHPAHTRHTGESIGAARVVPGITILLRDSLHLIRGKRVGLITNHTGRDEHGRSTIDLLHQASGVTLAAIFAPEHGIRGASKGGARISAGVDEKTGVQIHSLYGDTRVPTLRMLSYVDVLVYDIQDVGARMYTYVWTMTLAAEAAGKAGKKLIVLDRPDPIRADIAEGGLIERRYRSFTGLHPVPLRYGLTPGELARFLVGTKRIDADVVVIPMSGYRRSMWWEDTVLEWVSPSPNIRDPEAASALSRHLFLRGDEPERRTRYRRALSSRRRAVVDGCIRDRANDERKESEWSEIRSSVAHDRSRREAWRQEDFHDSNCGDRSQRCQVVRDCRAPAAGDLHSAREAIQMAAGLGH